VIRSAIPSTGTTGPNLIAQFVEQPRERYRARYLRGDSLAGRMTDVVALVPRATDLPYSEAVVWIDRNDGLVRRIEIAETSGQRRTLVLDKVVVNRGVPGREFTFSPPAGLRVVNQ
jgi:outer membrane lipoprotein-sorting protein